MQRLRSHPDTALLVFSCFLFFIADVCGCDSVDVDSGRWSKRPATGDSGGRSHPEL